MRIRKKGASLIEKIFLIIVVFTTTLNGQYYSEQMQQQKTRGSAVQDPLTLQEIQAEVSTRHNSLRKLMKKLLFGHIKQNLT